MISERIKPTFEHEGQKYYYFLKTCITSEGKLTMHLFIFDEYGLLDECRYFLTKLYLKTLARDLKRRTPVNDARYHRYYELDPNGQEGYPKAQYLPLYREIPLDADETLTMDRLYHFEMLKSRLRTAVCNRQETPNAHHV